MQSNFFALFTRFVPVGAPCLSAILRRPGHCDFNKQIDSKKLNLDVSSDRQDLKLASSGLRVFLGQLSEEGRSLKTLCLECFDWNERLSEALRNYIASHSTDLKELNLFGGRRLSDNALKIIFPAVSASKTLVRFKLVGLLTSLTCGRMMASLRDNDTLEDIDIISWMHRENDRHRAHAEMIVQCVSNLKPNKGVKKLHFRTSETPPPLTVADLEIILDCLRSNCVLREIIPFLRSNSEKERIMI
jgi:hypothetical protein